MKEKTWDQISKAERVKLLLSDQKAYMDMVPAGHWLLILDGIAKIGSLTDESNATQ